MARALSVGMALVALLAVGCTGEDADTNPLPRTEWIDHALPMPPGEPGRIAVRDATHCGDRWWVVGGVLGRPPTGVLGDTGESRPAAWSSTDLESWEPARFDAENFWAQLATITSVGCRDGEVALLGAKSGGAHGNPRVSSWYARADGTFVDVLAPLSQYGGDEGVSADRILGSGDGWLISGNRVQGPAVWTSADARGFELLTGAPQLSNDDGNQALAIDHTPTRDGWAVVGSASIPGRVPRVPVAWTSPDGLTWTREEVPTGDGFGALERVAAVGDDLVAVGLRDDGFGAWVRADGDWEQADAFGRLDPDRVAAPTVSGLVSLDDALLATTSDGSYYDLWIGDPDGTAWTRLEAPTRPGTGGERLLTLAEHDGTVLFVGDDGEEGRIWSADLGAG